MPVAGRIFGTGSSSDHSESHDSALVTHFVEYPDVHEDARNRHGLVWHMLTPRHGCVIILRHDRVLKKRILAAAVKTCVVHIMAVSDNLEFLENGCLR